MCCNNIQKHFFDRLHFLPSTVNLFVRRGIVLSSCWSLHLLQQSENKHKQEVPNDGFIQEGSKEVLDPLEKKGLDGLLSFINGTDKGCPEKVTDKEITAKAAKRARQKQRKVGKLKFINQVTSFVCFFFFSLYLLCL